MRIAFIGASEVAIMAAQSLIENGHEVILVEENQEKLDELCEELDCSFLHGDGSSPAILKELGPKETDILICISNNDQANLIASLVGRSLGFKRVVTSIEDDEFEGICGELGLEDTIVPARTIARHLEDMVYGVDTIKLSTVLKDEARLFTFTARKEDEKPIADLDLPKESRVICYYRDGKFALAGDDTKLHKGDEAVILTRSEILKDLEKRWQPKQASGANSERTDR